MALTEEERREFRQEVEEQDRLIKGFQTENEAATGALRRVQAQWRERERILVSENHRLTSEISALQAAGTSGKVHEAQRLRRMLNAEAELNAAREAFADREGQLKLDSDRARAKARELEARILPLVFNLLWGAAFPMGAD